MNSSRIASGSRIVSGMRPTGPLHLGHYFGVLVNWLALQKEHECFYFVADWHALTSEYAHPKKTGPFVPELVKDWLAVGLDPARCVIYQQSQVKEVAELHLILSMMTPLGWLERCPTYKDMKQQLVAKDLNTYGFLGYPVLMTTDIIIMRPQAVPVGEDQLPHLELCREITRRFNTIACPQDAPLFPEANALLTKESKLPGLDGRKMSKSYGNAIALGEDMDSVHKKIRSMLTDTNRKRKTDPGNPAVCNLYPYHELLSPPEQLPALRAACKDASQGCVDCKRALMEPMEAFLTPVHERRAQYDTNPDMLFDILHEGNKKARQTASQTLAAAREAIGFV